MTHKFRSVSEALASPFLNGLLDAPPQYLVKTDRVLKSTRLEDSIYGDLRREDAEQDALENACTPKLSTFPALSRDVYQSVYSLNLRKRTEEELSTLSKQFNTRILDTVMESDDYPAIKAVCEGRQLPAYEAAQEFITRVAGDLDQLLRDAGGDKRTLDTLEKLEQKRDASLETLRRLLEQRAEGKPNPEQDKKLLAAVNTAQSQTQQAQAVARMARDAQVRNDGEIKTFVTGAVKAAREKAEETALALAAWGTGDISDSPETMALNREVLEKTRQSPALQAIARYLGRFKEMLSKARKNGYAYGRGEKYSVELGGSVSRALSSEFALLAVPETVPLFLRKLQRRGLKQYKRREPVRKGAGDIICCLDESGSTKGDSATWGKAVALTLLDAAVTGKRKFALVHFSSRNQCKTDVFRPGQYTTQDVYAAAETFLGGNTDFETPLREALRLMAEEDFSNADIVFITDGACALPEPFAEELRQKRAATPFTVTGVLLDAGAPGFAFSLTPFCQEIYRTSQLAGDEIARALIQRRVA